MVKDFFESYKWDGRPWLLVGMGPSFDAEKVKSASSIYNVMGINKVVREVPVDICHIIDFYIVDKVAEWITSQAQHLAIPYFPHFGYRPIIHFTAKDLSLRLDQSIRDKILCYNLSTIPIKMSPSPTIRACYFNAEASLNLIAHLGCKEVHAIGIDGGKERSSAFSDHGPCDPRGFDLQWTTMATTIKTYGINYSNLDGSSLNPKLQELLCPTSSEPKSISSSAR